MRLYNDNSGVFVGPRTAFPQILPGRLFQKNEVSISEPYANTHGNIVPVSRRNKTFGDHSAVD
jgi:hypothetical protein